MRLGLPRHRLQLQLQPAHSDSLSQSAKGDASLLEHLCLLNVAVCGFGPDRYIQHSQVLLPITPPFVPVIFYIEIKYVFLFEMYRT